MAILRRYRWIWIGLTAALIIGAGLIALRQGRDVSAANDDVEKTATAFVGSLSDTAAASGQVQAQRDSELSLLSSGIVESVFVEVGDWVEAGEVLLQLETEALERSVTSAEKDVAIAEAELAELLAGPEAEEVEAAEAAVISARARLEELLAGPTEEQIAASEAGLRSAASNLGSALGQVQAVKDISQADILAAEADLTAALEQQESAHNMWVRLADCEETESGSYDCVPTESGWMDTATQNVQAANAQVALARARLDEATDPNANSLASAQASVSSSTALYEAAQARHEALMLGATEAETTAAEAELANAEATLQRLLDGPKKAEIKLYEIRLAQAQTAVREAETALGDAALYAPFDGQVTAVHVREGESAAGTIIRVTDTANLEIVLNVDEVDIGRLFPGQPAVVTLESWPGTELESEVAVISPTGLDGGNGIISYEVHLSLLDTELPVRVGMTANADLLAADSEDVLLVPNAAVMADRDMGTYSVGVVTTEADGTTSVKPVEVTVGLKDSRYTEITSGLAEGDVVVLGELDAPTISFGQGTRSPFGGN